MSKVIIIGTGPAGVSAALYTKRANIDTLLIGKDHGALTKAHAIENYYGLTEPLTGVELAQAGLLQAEQLGCEVVMDEVVSIGFTDKLTVQTKLSMYEGDAVILATGAARNTPKIDGLTRFEGKGVSYCAVCDAFFYRGKAVCVLGDGDYALHEAQELLPVVGSVTLLTNGFAAGDRLDRDSLPQGLKLDMRKLAAIDGETVVSNVRFEDGDALAVSGVFVAVGVASSSDLAKKLGAVTEGKSITVNQKMETNIPGLYAAGDCTGGLLQVAKAVYEGAKAGTEVIKYIRSL